MSAIVIPFPCGRRDRAKTISEPEKVAADINAMLGLAEPTLEGRVRAIGFRFGLNHFDRESLVALARQHIGWGFSPEKVLQRAELAARNKAAQDPPPKGAA